MADEQEARSGGTNAETRNRLIAIAVLVAVTVALVLDNTHDVAVDYVVGSTDAPLITVLVVTWLLGLAIGWLGGRRGRRG